MKYYDKHRINIYNRSLPVRGAWIEIWRNLVEEIEFTSLPVRGAWIEIGSVAVSTIAIPVAPRKGSVD